MTTNDWSKSLFQLSSNYYAYKNVICLIRPFRSSLRALLIVSNKSETKVRKNSIFVLFILRFQPDAFNSLALYSSNKFPSKITHQANSFALLHCLFIAKDSIRIFPVVFEKFLPKIFFHI